MSKEDKTWGVKVSEELFQRAEALTNMSTDNKKTWFEKVIEREEMMAIKNHAAEFQSDITELEVHTTRIYALVNNMMKKSIYLRDEAVGEAEGKLLKQTELVEELREQVKLITEKAKIAQEELTEAREEQEQMRLQLVDIRQTNENNQLLIEEYRSKNDTLNGLVTKYQRYAEENEKLREEMEQARTEADNFVNQLTSEIREQEAKINEQAKEITQFTQSIEELKVKEKEKRDRLAEAKDLEREKAILKVERELQKQIADSNEEYNSRVKVLYDEMNRIRNEYHVELAQIREETEKKNKE